jgi:hypothetical protein
MVQICLGSVQFTAHAINFFLYCFSTKNFRNELRDFIQEIVFYSITLKSTTTTTATMLNSTTENTKKKYFLNRRYRDRESTIENQQTGQQFALKDMQTILINDAND